MSGLILVCGGRDFTNYEQLCAVLDAVEPDAILHGGAKGADSLADKYARARGLPVFIEHANWAKYGSRAGIIRNAKMITNHSPSMVIAFPGGPGTADMAARARYAGFLVVQPK